MQLLAIIVFLLFSQYEVTSRHHGRFAQELEHFQNSLVKHIYDDTSLDPQEDNDEIESIVDAILDEADRRLKKRDGIHKHHQRKDHAHHRVYKQALSDAYNDIVDLYKSSIKKKEISQHKRGIQTDKDEYKRKHKKEIRQKKITLALNIKSKRENILQENHVSTRSNEAGISDDGSSNSDNEVKADGSNNKKTTNEESDHNYELKLSADDSNSNNEQNGDTSDDEVKVINLSEVINSDEISNNNEIAKNDEAANDVSNNEISNGDNVQVASIKVDNSLDQQTQLVNNAAAAKDLFLEPNSTATRKNNISLYAQKSEKNVPNVLLPQKVTTNRVDKSGLDEFSFIAVIVGCCVAGIAGIALASFCWYKLRSETKDLKNGGSDFKSNSLRNSDRKKPSDEEKLARGAEVFHYLHAKKQMQQMEEPNLKADHCAMDESSDDEEDEDTVYECPGLAAPGDMKVVNPLFSDTDSHYSDAASVQSTPTPPAEEK